MKEVTNLHTQPLALEDGTVLAAAGTDGATKAVDSVSETDARLVDRNLIIVRDKTTADRRPQTAEPKIEPTVASSPVAGHRSPVGALAPGAAAPKEI